MTRPPERRLLHYLAAYDPHLSDLTLALREIVLAVLVVGAISLWVMGSSVIDPTLTAMAGIALMLVCGVVTWDDMAKNHAAWTTLVLLATLVTLADGLSRAGFRRSHRFAYRPACRACNACVPVRIAVERFAHTRSTRRIRNANAALAAS